MGKSVLFSAKKLIVFGTQGFEESVVDQTV